MKPDMPWFSSQSGGHFLRNVKYWENGVRRVSDEKMERSFWEILGFRSNNRPYPGSIKPNKQALTTAWTLFVEFNFANTLLMWKLTVRSEIFKMSPMLCAVFPSPVHRITSRSRGVRLI